jgi:hypothetical protein
MGKVEGKHWLAKSKLQFIHESRCGNRSVLEEGIMPLILGAKIA